MRQPKKLTFLSYGYNKTRFKNLLILPGIIKARHENIKFNTETRLYILQFVEPIPTYRFKVFIKPFFPSKAFFTKNLKVTEKCDEIVENFTNLERLNSLVDVRPVVQEIARQRNKIKQFEIIRYNDIMRRRRR